MAFILPPESASANALRIREYKDIVMSFSDRIPAYEGLGTYYHDAVGTERSRSNNAFAPAL